MFAWYGPRCRYLVNKSGQIDTCTYILMLIKYGEYCDVVNILVDGDLAVIRGYKLSKDKLLVK